MKKWAEEFVEAFQHCDKDKIKQMLKSGFPHSANLRVLNSNTEKLNYRSNPIHLSAEYGYIEIMQELITAGADPNSRDSFQRTPLMIACSMGHLEIVRFLVEQINATVRGFDFEGNSILHISASAGQYLIVRYLIEDLEIPVNLLNKSKQTALASCQNSQDKSSGEVS